MSDVPPHPTGTPTPTCPAHALTALYGEAFAADPHAAYAALRGQGPAALVEIAPGTPAMLVTSYQMALKVLRGPKFVKDPRPWQHGLPPDSPIRAVVEHRDNALYSDGLAHTRLRSAVSDSLDGVDQMVLRGQVTQIADSLIAGFAASGRVDLLHGYAKPLALLVFTKLFGCPHELGIELMVNTQAIFDGTDPKEANARLGRTLADLIVYRERHPGNDVVTRLIQHPAKLSHGELSANLLVMMGAGSEPTAGLIANALYVLLTDTAGTVAGDVVIGTLSVDEALDDVLWEKPPMSNYAIHFPISDVELDGVLLPARQPVVISFEACNADPTLWGAARNRAHLAFSAGVHACPVSQMARLIASAAIDTLLDRLHGLRLDPDAPPPRWRAAPFTRGLLGLAAAFPPPVRATPAPATSGAAS